MARRLSTTAFSALLVLALSGLTGAVGVVNPSPAFSADGDALVLGQANTAQSETSLAGPAPGTSDAALRVTASGPSGTAVVASAGGIGVKGTGSTGVAGASNSVNGAGVVGEDLTGSNIGRGVHGGSPNGWGVYAVSPNGQALRVDGRATFSRSGIVVVPAHQIRVTVSGVALSNSTSFPERPSIVLAEVQEDVNRYVVAAVPNVADSSITIRLNKAASSPIRVGWFIVN